MNRLDPVQFAIDVLLDCIRSQTPGRWRQLATELDESRPRFGDFHGAATREQLRIRHDELTAAATACRHHADLLEDSGHVDDEDLLRATAYDVISGQPAA